MRWGWAVAGLAALWAGAAPAETLILNSEESPPFNFTAPASGSFVGISTEIVQALMERAGIAYEIRVLPWQRAYNGAQTEPNTCVFSTNDTEERHALFKWVGPLARGGWTLFGREDSTISISSLEDAKPYLIAVQAGSGLEEHLKTLGGFRLDANTSNPANAKKLTAGRVDIWAFGKQAGPFLAKTEGVGRLKPLFTLRESLISMACNKEVPDATIAKLNETLEQMRAEGVLDRVYAKYE
ncbi:MAG TPA: transporter substrate-binding domain-containing protein [Alphaproteobacteria bacterium]|nr:transporter substrate-binding domain-containing protein [Alphaproteobacteria bacterium]